jgi:hypothetical protein
MTSASKPSKDKTHKTTNFPFVLYECETCSVTLREEYRAWKFDSRTPGGQQWGLKGGRGRNRELEIVSF